MASMLSRTNNLHDLWCVEQSRSNLKLDTCAFQDTHNVRLVVREANVERIALFNDENAAMFYAHDRYHKHPHWIIPPMDQIPLSKFSNDEDYVRVSELAKVAFTGNIHDVPLEYNSNVSWNLFSKRFGPTTITPNVLTTNLETLEDAEAAREFLGLSEFQTLNDFNQVRDVAINELYWNPSSPLRTGGIVRYDPYTGRYDLPELHPFPIATSSTYGLCRLDNAHVHTLRTMQGYKQELETMYLRQFDSIIERVNDYVEQVHSNNTYFASKYNHLRDFDDIQAVKDRLKVGTISQLNRERLELQTSPFVVEGTAYIPSLALQRFGGTRDDNDRNKRMQLALGRATTEDDAFFIYHLPHNEFPIATSDTKGLVRVYKNEASSTLDHFKTNPEEFGISYRYFLTLTTSNDALLNSFNPTLSMDDYQDVLNTRTVRYSNVFLFTEFTNRYVTSNMLRRENNLDEIRGLLNNQIPKSYIDYTANLDTVLANEEFTEVDRTFVKEYLESLSNLQQIRTVDYSDPVVRNDYLMRLYKELEIEPIAYTSTFDSLTIRPDRVSLFDNDVPFFDRQFPFEQIKDDEESKRRCRESLGIGTAATQHASAVHMSGTALIARSVHVKDSLIIPKKIQTLEDDVVVMGQTNGDAMWTTTPIANAVIPEQYGIVRMATSVGLDMGAAVPPSLFRSVRDRLKQKLRETEDVIRNNIIGRGDTLNDYMRDFEIVQFEPV